MTNNKIMNTIAIVGIACQYPDANSPIQLWENALSQRQAFRQIPSKRLNLNDYFSPDPNTPDRTYTSQAAVIEGYEFDRVKFRVPSHTYHSADLAHWLALDIASKALTDAGFAQGEGLPHDMTGVLVGNSLTGEFSRANVMRLRWPYVRRVLDSALIEQNWTTEQRQRFLAGLESKYKEPFPEIGAESLAGGLSNTIAGRICNYFNLKGGGYTLDGACSSSLLAVANACSALVAGDLDVALAGGVDLSIDPFELIGFAKTGALTPDKMRVYDTHSAGFLPGEGCGFIVLMRYQDAIAQCRKIYGTIRGWGISSDGSGGITRPEVEGQLLALQRAYRKAGFTPDTVAYFEGHGTGTPVGDATELKTICSAIQESQRQNGKSGENETLPPAVISSIKANIGHTKAAAGIAGLIKATMALYHQILPPTTGCEHPHPALIPDRKADAVGAGFTDNIRQPTDNLTKPALGETEDVGAGFTDNIQQHTDNLTKPALGETEDVGAGFTDNIQQHTDNLTKPAPALRVLNQGEPWSPNYPLRAGVSAMGFGGINTHIVLEGISRHPIADTGYNPTLWSTQDAELLLLGGKDISDLHQQVTHLLTLAPQLSYAEITDLAAELAKTVNHNKGIRAAIVASSPQELTTRLETLSTWLNQGITSRLEQQLGLFLGTGTTQPRIGFLFPGQASPTYFNGGAWSRRFPGVKQLYEQANLPIGDSQNTAIAQPAIVTASIAGIQTLDEFNINGAIAIGHSLGEITALHWAGAFDTPTLLHLVKVRGQAMAELGNPTGKMASIRGDKRTVAPLIKGKQVAIAGFNSPQQTIISGDAQAITTVMNRATHQGIKTITLPVSHAFHSPLVAAATPPLADYLATQTLHPLQRPVISTVTGDKITPDTDVRSLLCNQITAPVRFIDAVDQVSAEIDLWLEVGSGQILSGLMGDFVKTPIFSLDAGGTSLKGLLNAIGATFALGTPINTQALYANRFTRPFKLDWQPQFFVNPCETNVETRHGASLCSNVEEAVGAGFTDNLLSMSDNVTKPALLRQTGRENTSSSPRHSTERQSPLETVRQLVAERTELPITAIKEDNHLLRDLHLNSITVSQLIADASRHLGLSAPVAPTDYANATIGEMVQALEDLARTGNHETSQENQQLPSGVDAWIRTFRIELVESPLSHRLPPSPTTPGKWQVFAPANHPLAPKLEQPLNNWGGVGVIVCLPPNPDEHHLPLLLSGAKAVLANQQTTHFILVQQGGGGAGFVRTLHQEVPNLTTCIIDLPLNHPQAAAWVLAEAKAAVGYSEAHYDTSGIRYQPVLQVLPLTQTDRGDKGGFSHIEMTTQDNRETHPNKLNATDLLLVTGGGKGIAAESALALAKETGIRLAILGRSQPETDTELAANLQRLTHAGIPFCYHATDVTKETAVREAIAQIESEFGTITAILHGAGTNIPQLLNSLDEAALQRTLAPKVQGLRNILAAVNPHQLKLLVTFGSIIARTGLPGEADYALANEWLTQLTEDFSQRYTNCRCLTIEWSVWSGVGMGERLGRIDTLMRQGITPIPPDTGVAILQRLIHQRLKTRSLPNSVIVAGRFGQAPTLKFNQSELPFQRFLEHPRVYIPSVELVVDSELSHTTDPYLTDHQVQGEYLFPAVMGLEAMAQVAMALMETESLPIFTDIKLNRPIVVPPNTSITIRIAALVQDTNQIDVVLRTETTGFGVNHFQATCRFNTPGEPCRDVPVERLPVERLEAKIKSSPVLPLQPKRDLYGSILFHQGRFQRLQKYYKLRAKECCAEIESNPPINWFSHYLPAQLILGDPGARDAVIHGIQACIPHRTLLPIGVEKIVIGSASPTDSWFLHATEKHQQGDTFTYDVDVTNPDGKLIEHWQGLKLKAVHPVTPDTWVAPLLSPYIERRIKEQIPNISLNIAVLEDAKLKRQQKSDRAIQQLIQTTVMRRPDGKPDINGNQAISITHAGNITLACASLNPIGCDIEPVVPRDTDVWQDLLGKERFNLARAIAKETQASLDITATRIWSASECLKKAGAMVNSPLVFLETPTAGEVWLESGKSAIATFILYLRDIEQPLIFAVLLQPTDNSTSQNLEKRDRSINHWQPIPNQEIVSTIYNG
ncbi:MAG: SDR family NAD(P)-dependent oxidoreductase [Coleofasciculus sp. F4-SAH-05]